MYRCRRHAHASRGFRRSCANVSVGRVLQLPDEGGDIHAQFRLNVKTPDESCGRVIHSDLGIRRRHDSAARASSAGRVAGTGRAARTKVGHELAGSVAIGASIRRRAQGPHIIRTPEGDLGARDTAFLDGHGHGSQRRHGGSKYRRGLGLGLVRGTAGEDEAIQGEERSYQHHET